MVASIGFEVHGTRKILSELVDVLFVVVIQFLSAYFEGKGMTRPLNFLPKWCLGQALQSFCLIALSDFLY